MIDIGLNDLANSLTKNLSYEEVVKTIPSVIVEIRNAIKALYGEGARKFWVHNTDPLGCLTQQLSLSQKTELDEDGRISSYNDAATLFKEGLLHLCQEMRSVLTDATVVYGDIYVIKHNLITDAASYGKLFQLHLPLVGRSR